MAFELYVTVNCFELDEAGVAHLNAFWRLTNLGASQIVDSGIFEAQIPGPRLSENPRAATVSLSETIGKLTEEIRHRMELAQSRRKD